MNEGALAGSRIRQRRLALGLRQAELAQDVGISASYLNLIEHNHRRIGGKLLAALAVRLDVDASLLAEGVEREVVGRLGDVAQRFGETISGGDAVDFAARFPNWANLTIRAARRINELERQVEALIDRMAHDPHLAASLHELLSTATAIRSTASILEEEGDLEPEWQKRFHRNLSEEAARLADGAQALVELLDGAPDARSEGGSPHEEMLLFLDQNGWHFPRLEEGNCAALDGYLGESPCLTSENAKLLARSYLEDYLRDAITMPLCDLRDALERYGVDPLAISRSFGIGVERVLHRLATLPDAGFGLVTCDASGTVLLRKAVDGFTVPRFGSACPLWPLFSGLSRPMMPMRQRIAQPGRSGENGAVLEAYAYAYPILEADYDLTSTMRSVMLLVPVGLSEQHSVGVTCRICPRAECLARREPSALSI